MINDIVRKLINQSVKIVTKLKKFNTLFTYNAKNILNQKGKFSPRIHMHNFLRRNQIPESTKKLEGLEVEQFSFKNHNHEQYSKKSLNIKKEQENIDGVTRLDLSIKAHKHNQYVLKTKTNFSTASKLYDTSNKNYIAPRVFFAVENHLHPNYVEFGTKAKQAEGLYATSYKQEGNNIIQYTEILKQDKISHRGHKHDDIYISKSIADETFAPKDFQIDEARGFQDGEIKNKIEIYRYIPANTTQKKEVETFDTNILTTEYFERNIATVDKDSIFGYIEEDKLHTAWRRNQIVNPESWADFPGDLNTNLGMSLSNLFGMKSIPGNNNTSYLLANMIMNEGTLDNVNLDDLYGKAASTQFIILFANSAVQKKLNEIGPKPIIEYTPEVQYVDVDVHTSMYKSFMESGKKQGSIKTTGPDQFLYNATSRSKTSTKPTTQYKENTKNWIYNKKTTADQIVSECNAATKMRDEIYSWYEPNDILYLRGLNKNEYYWYYDVPAQPDLGETANIFEYITETISLTVENYFKKIFDLFVVLLLSIDYFLCLGINYIFSLFDNLLVSIITPIMLFHIYIDLALFKIDYMPAWRLISLFKQFVMRKPLVPIAKFAASNPMGTNIILLSKEVSTRFSTEWRRLIGHTPVIKTPYQMVNTLKIKKEDPNSSVVFIQPSGNFNLDKNYAQILNSWTANTGVPRYKGPHLLKNGELSYDIIPAKNKINWKYIGFSAQNSSQEIIVNNYGLPFTIVGFTEDKGEHGFIPKSEINIYILSQLMAKQTEEIDVTLLSQFLAKVELPISFNVLSRLLTTSNYLMNFNNLVRGIKPNAPSNLTVEALSSSSIKLNWVDNSDNETNFEIERKTGINGTWEVIAVVNANTTTYINSGLNYNTTYYYKIRAYNNTVTSDYSNEAYATTFDTIPNTPNNLIATALSTSQIKLTWADNSDNETGFKIERKTGTNGTWEIIATVDANITTFTNSGLSYNTTYYYRVWAYNEVGNSNYSNEASATTFNVIPDGIPSGLTAQALSSSQIKLTWVDNSTNETGFKIERKTGTNGAWEIIATVDANITTFTNSGLSYNTTYYYRVWAYNEVGNSNYSNEASATTFNVIPNGIPSGLTAQTLSSSQIKLTWVDNSTNETGFKIERKTGTNGAWEIIATVDANITTFTNSGLNYSTTYYYRVQAYNEVGNSNYSNEASATTLNVVPRAPSSLSAQALSSSSIELNWVDNSDNETGFKIERKTGTNGIWTEIATVGANVTTFTNNGLTYNTTYYYRVKSYNSVGNSSFSNEASATTLNVVPSTPSGLTAQALSSSQIKLTWVDNSTNETGFKIERKIGANGAWTEIATVGANVTTYTNSSLTYNTTYYYRVRSYNSVGNSSFSNEAYATTPNVVPSTPSSLSVQALSSSQIKLTWRDNSNNETGFKIERKIGANGAWTEIATVGANVTTFTNNGLTYNTTYYYRVWAYNEVGNSNYSNEAYATTPNVVPSAPSSLSAQALSSSQIKLTWRDNSNNETGFKIERKIGANGIWTEIATVGANVTTFTNNGLTYNTTYYYRVRSYNSVGNSSFSNEASATTLNVIPNAPSNLTATVLTSSNRIELIWQDNSNNESGFSIERKTGTNGSWGQIATVSANTETYTDVNSNPNTTYCYRVRAYNNVGYSSYSNEKCATTFDTTPVAPTVLTAAAISPTEVQLTWKDNSNNESGFKVERRVSGGSWQVIKTLSANTMHVIDTGLTPDTTYYYRVRAYNSAGDSGYSNEAYTTTLKALPIPPNNLRATALSSSQISLTWIRGSTNETGFEIERKTGTNGSWARIAVVRAGVTTFTNSGLSANTTYYYRVRAYNSAGNSAYSNEAHATTLAAIPAAPTDLKLSFVSTSQIYIIWKDNSNNETGFKIERRRGSSAWSVIATVGKNINGYVDLNFLRNTTYYYRVRAYNENGYSAYSNTITVTTP